MEFGELPGHVQLVPEPVLRHIRVSCRVRPGITVNTVDFDKVTDLVDKIACEEDERDMARWAQVIAKDCNEAEKDILRAKWEARSEELSNA